MSGYTGKILRVNLSLQEISTLDTADYEQWGGGHGIGSALFWDLVEDKTISGFGPSNVVTIMTSPLTGTMVPGGGARTEVQGIGVQSYPYEWFTRSGLGGRFGPMLKFAGWDGVVIEGKADSPVWLDIRDGNVQIKDAAGLWGRDTWQTQEAIWEEVIGGSGYGGWVETDDAADSGTRSTQRPAVLAIGPAGENKCRVASLVHDAGSAAGQGGFGAVWGSKNLKAISVVGTGHIAVADPNALIQARLWAMENYTFALDDYDKSMEIWANMPSNFRSFPAPLVFWNRPKQSRPQACIGCQAGCRSRYGTGFGNESSCKDSGWYGMFSREVPDPGKQAADIAQKLGINAGELETGVPYLRDLNKLGVLGPGKQIDCDLPFDKFGQIEFAEQLLTMIANREGLGDDMAEGFTRASARWGRLEEDLGTGLLNNCNWGLAMHYDPRNSLEWGYGTILGDRDINEHGFNPLYMIPFMTAGSGQPFSAEDFVKMYSERMPPYDDDPLMLDYGESNMYSEHIAKLVSWHRYYSRFWIQSVLYCDFQYPDFFNWAAKDYRGITGEGEPKFFNAVTGKSLSFAEGIETGKKIWNLDNAIWTLQGRHRDMVQFADYIYDVDSPSWFIQAVREDGQWKYDVVGKRRLDRDQFEAFKTRYYELEGWDTQTGRPTRQTLESLGMAGVADELESNGKLGKQ